MKIQKGTAAFSKTNIARFAAGFVTFINVYTVQTLFPHFSDTYNVSSATASLALSAATLPLTFSLIVFGSLSKEWGRKPLMVLSLIATSIITIALAFTPTFESLLALRILQGVAFAGVPSIAMAYEQRSWSQVASVLQTDLAIFNKTPNRPLSIWCFVIFSKEI